MLNDLIKSHVAPLLKRHGFKKKNKTWNKTVDGFVQVINFQLSSYSCSQEQSFTINLGLFCPEVWNICWQKVPPKFVLEYKCFPGVRIGELLYNFENPLDHWWECSQHMDNSGLADEISVLLEGKCIPFLDGLLSKQNISEFYSSYAGYLLPLEKIYLAIVRNHVGDKNSSSELLDSVDSNGCWADLVRIVRSQLS